ncbi:adenylate/guanylate cyclase domain-containing protein [Sideroxydans lithotrophicus]|uniref:Adenylate cyclase n=1 Tax=Sideroxydans lithotrophicus (strain ES-1) TaxID=580332 RepID=D5CS43_SIDLE|nr:adenylate/guanylate cyclase domain-containing protein [Sideroxydans lithotrophicus]ADE11779.1 adenylate/guanylate cyclase [Sideroxydans lithotrophicus ES-1]
MTELINRLIDRIDNAATLPEDPPPVRLQKTLLIFLNAAGFLLVPWGAWYLFDNGMALPAQVVLGYSVLSAVALAHLLATKRVSIASALQLVGLLLVPVILQWTMGGFVASGAIVLWSLLAPLCALVFLGTRLAVWWFAVFALLVLVAAARDIANGVTQQQVLLYCENVLLVSAIAFISLRFFVVERDKAQAALQREQARSESLLLNILPPPIAERLKAGSQTIADGYAEATILFADLVGFTKMSTTVSPERLVVMLNSLFSRFDELSGRFGVEKIKTIGDAYMACAGVPVARPDHAEAVVDMALAMREALQEHNREFGSNLQIRIGINTGPVVAGVIGLKKFIYDLWGDTVNLASRMESNGVPNRVQVSMATWEKLRDKYDFEPRGVLDVKGIGLVEAYLLIGKKT